MKVYQKYKVDRQFKAIFGRINARYSQKALGKQEEEK